MKDIKNIITPDPDATVPKPIVETKKKPESKEDANDATDTVSENVREGLAAAELQDDNKNAPPVPPVPKPNRRRSRQLLQVDANLNGGGSKEEEKEQGRIAVRLFLSLLCPIVFLLLTDL